MDKLSSWDATLVLWIAGGVAAIFVFIVIYDASRQRRQRSPNAGRRRANKRTNPAPPSRKPVDPAGRQ